MTRKRSPDVTDGQIVEAYRRLVSSRRVAEELDVSERRVCLTLRRHGIPRTGLEAYRKAAQKYPEGVQLEILRLHNSGATLTELRSRFGGSYSSIETAIVRNGGVVRKGVTSRQVASREQAAEMCDLYRAGLSQDRIADQTGFSQAVISRVLRENGIAMRRGAPVGELHPHWKGGRMRNGDGYMLVFVPPSDPMAVMRNRSGYVLEHRLVMARQLGRPLRRGETVHHINGDRADNEPTNLQLRRGRHGNGVVMTCLDCGSHNIGPAPLASAVTED